MKPSRSRRFAHLIIRRFYPEVCEIPEVMIRSMDKLEQERDEAREATKKWRMRALSAERVIQYEVRVALNNAIDRHEREHCNCD